MQEGQQKQPRAELALETDKAALELSELTQASDTRRAIGSDSSKLSPQEVIGVSPPFFEGLKVTLLTARQPRESAAPTERAKELKKTASCD